MARVWLGLGAWLLLLPVPSAAQVLFRDRFAGGKMDSGWQMHASSGNTITLRDGVVEIHAAQNTFAHLDRPLRRDGVTASARIRASNPPAVSWCTSLFLVWNNANWCQLGTIPADDAGRYYVTEMVEGASLESFLGRCDLAAWHYVRIELGRDCVRYYSSDDGARWRCLRVVERPDGFVGPPALLAVGKGFGRGTAPYAAPNLQNDYAGDRGAMGMSLVADVRLELTPPARLRLTEAERLRLKVADRDPVGRIELARKEDPTFERVARYYPAMQAPREAISVPDHPDDIGVDYLGRLQLSNTPGAPGAPATWLEAGTPAATPTAGAGRWQRRLLEGWIPVVLLRSRQRGLACEQTAFAWSEGFRPESPLFAFVRLRVRAAEGVALPSVARQICQPGDRRIEWPLSPCGLRTAQVCLRIPFGQPERASSLPSDAFEGLLREVRTFWRRTLSGGARLTVPERRVAEAHRAWLAYSLIDVDRVKGLDEPHDGCGFYEEIYGYSAALYCHALDYYGQHERARRYLATLLHFQQPAGLYTQNFGLPDQGALLFALAEHHRLTGDVAWLRTVSGNIVRACEWIVRQRAAAPRTGVVAGLIRFRPYCDYPEPTVNYYANAYCCIGLEHAAAVLGAAGPAARAAAARFRDEARRYRSDLLRSMDAAPIRRKGQTIIPLEPETHRLLRAGAYGAGDYYGLVASCLLETGLPAPHDRRSHIFTRFLEEKGGLLAGLSRFGPGGVDHAYTYGYLVTHLQRGDARRVVLGFYGMLAYGMTRDTYSGVEVTTAVSGANQQTLPHLYSSTQQLRLLRLMLLREEGESLRIGDAIPRHWLADGKRVALERAPTQFGDTSFDIESRAGSGRIVVRLRPPTRIVPRQVVLRLRHPGFLPIRSVRVDGRPWRGFRGETVTLAAPRRPVRVEALYAPASVGTAERSLSVGRRATAGTGQ